MSMQLFSSSFSLMNRLKDWKRQELHYMVVVVCKFPWLLTGLQCPPFVVSGHWWELSSSTSTLAAWVWVVWSVHCCSWTVSCCHILSWPVWELTIRPAGAVVTKWHLWCWRWVDLISSHLVGLHSCNCPLACKFHDVLLGTSTLLLTVPVKTCPLKYDILPYFKVFIELRENCVVHFRLSLVKPIKLKTASPSSLMQ